MNMSVEDSEYPITQQFNYDPYVPGHPEDEPDKVYIPRPSGRRVINCWQKSRMNGITSAIMANGSSVPSLAARVETTQTDHVSGT